jgi:hypothetical protein
VRFKLFHLLLISAAILFFAQRTSARTEALDEPIKLIAKSLQADPKKAQLD